MARGYPSARAARQRAAEDDRARRPGVAAALARDDDLLVPGEPPRELGQILRAGRVVAGLAVGADGLGEAEPLGAAARGREPDGVRLVAVVRRHPGRRERERELALGGVEPHDAGALGSVDPAQRDLADGSRGGARRRGRSGGGARRGVRRRGGGVGLEDEKGEEEADEREQDKPEQHRAADPGRRGGHGARGGRRREVWSAARGRLVPEGPGPRSGPAGGGRGGDRSGLLLRGVLAGGLLLRGLLAGRRLRRDGGRPGGGTRRRGRATGAPPAVAAGSRPRERGGSSGSGPPTSASWARTVSAHSRAPLELRSSRRGARRGLPPSWPSRKSEICASVSAGISTSGASAERPACARARTASSEIFRSSAICA